MLSPFDTIPERDGQTDRRTDRRSNGQNSYINIARQHLGRLLLRGGNIESTFVLAENVEGDGDVEKIGGLRVVSQLNLSTRLRHTIRLVTGTLETTRQSHARTMTTILIARG